MPGYLTHAYFASKFSKNPNYILGSMAPDFTLLISRDHTHHLIRGLIKYLTLLKRNKNFIGGLRNHVLFDSYMHKNYIYKKADSLARKTGVPSRVTEGLLELAIDIDINNKNKKLYDKVRDSLNYIEEDDVIAYLSRRLIVKKKKIEKALDDGCKVVSIKNPFSMRGMIKRGLILREYYHIRFLRGVSLFKLKSALEEAKKAIKGYEKHIDKAYKVVKRELKNAK